VVARGSQGALCDDLRRSQCKEFQLAAASECPDNDDSALTGTPHSSNLHRSLRHHKQLTEWQGDTRAHAHPHVYVVGMGMRLSHLTPEVSAALAASETVFLLTHIPGTAEALREYCNKVIDLSQFYEEQPSRLDTYRRMVSVVLEEAASAPPVTFAAYGHPLFVVQAGAVLVRVGRQLGLAVSVLPGISSFDTILADLGVDLIDTGLQMHDATELVLYQRRLVPSMSTLLWQVGFFGTALHTTRTSKPGRLARLEEYLLRFFPARHPVFSVTSAVGPGEVSHVQSFTLQELDDHAAGLHAGVTLYVPPSEPENVADQELLDRLNDREHLQRVTREYRLPEASEPISYNEQGR
jgi:tetrapyrrole methylase family protein/MazG family protein